MKVRGGAGCLYKTCVPSHIQNFLPSLRVWISDKLKPGHNGKTHFNRSTDLQPSVPCWIPTGPSQWGMSAVHLRSFHKLRFRCRVWHWNVWTLRDNLGVLERRLEAGVEPGQSRGWRSLRALRQWPAVRGKSCAELHVEVWTWLQWRRRNYLLWFCSHTSFWEQQLWSTVRQWLL